MSLHYIIDGYNIINHPLFTRLLKSPLNPRATLLLLIRKKRLTGSLKNKVTVVFDGYPDANQTVLDEPDITVIFSRKVSADEKINLLIEETANRKIIIVVSDDREIQYNAKSLGAKVLGIDEFFAAAGNRQVNTKKLEPAKTELNYSQMQKINEELRRLWLKE